MYISVLNSPPTALKNDAEEESKSTTTSFAKCKKYEVTIGLNDNLEFHANFIEALKQIEDKLKEDPEYAADKLLELYGTHFAEQIDMGSSLTIEKTFDEKLSVRYEEDKTNQCKDKSGTEFNSVQNIYNFISTYAQTSNNCHIFVMIYAGLGLWHVD